MRLFCFGSLVILDVARCYLWLFTLYINIKIGKIVVKGNRPINSTIEFLLKLHTVVECYMLSEKMK